MASRRIFDLIFKTRGLDTAKSQTDQLDSSFNNLASTAKTIAVGFVSMQTAMKAVEMAKMAAQTDNVRKSFGNLAKEPDKMLKAMKKATAGTISEMELMQKFNEAALLGLPLDRFDEMLEIARGAAQATGQSMDFMLQSVVVALGRQSKLMLDNLGIMIDTEKANEKYAESLNKTVSQLTDQEKKQAFVNEALALGQNNLQKIGGVSASAVDSFAALNASFEDLQVSLGKELLPILIPIVENLTEMVKNLDVEKVKSYAQGLAILTTGFLTYKTAVIASTGATKLFRSALIRSGLGALVVGLGEAIHMYSEYKEETEDATDKQIPFRDIVKSHVAEQNKLNVEFKNYKTIIDEIGDVEIFTEEDVIAMSGFNTEFATFGERFSEYSTQQMITLANEKEQEELRNKFIELYPEEAKKLGLLTNKQKENANQLQQTINLSNTLATSLSAAFDPNQSAGEAFQGFIINVITALQGVILASKAVSEALTTTFIPGLGVGGALVALAGLEAAKAGVRSVRFAQFGMDEMVSQPTLIMAGEAGPERVQVTPASRPGATQGNGSGMTINFNGPVTNKEFIRDTVLPEIQRVQDLGLA